MHKHLREVSSMRLILRLIQDDLNRANDCSRCVFSHQHDALAALYTRGDAAPIRLRLGAGHWEHEADRRPTFHAVDQHVAQPLDLALTKGLRTLNLNAVRHRAVLQHSGLRIEDARSLKPNLSRL